MKDKPSFSPLCLFLAPLSLKAVCNQVIAQIARALNPPESLLKLSQETATEQRWRRALPGALIQGTTEENERHGDTFAPCPVHRQVLL